MPDEPELTDEPSEPECSETRSFQMLRDRALLYLATEELAEWERDMYFGKDGMFN